MTGTDSAAIGLIAAREAIPLVELTPQHATLEEAFMEITRDAVEFHGEQPIAAAERCDDAPPVALGSGRVTQTGVVASEWIKLRSLRSTWFSFAAAVLIADGLGTLFSALHANRMTSGAGPKVAVPSSTRPKSACGACSSRNSPSACSAFS